MLQAVTFGVLWLGLIVGALAWHVGYLHHASERSRVKRLSDDLAVSLFHPEQLRDALRRYDSYGTAGREGAIDFAWTDTTRAIGIWLACAVLWPVLAQAGRTGHWRRAARWAVIGGMAGGAMCAILMALDNLNEYLFSALLTVLLACPTL